MKRAVPVLLLVLSCAPAPVKQTESVPSPTAQPAPTELLEAPRIPVNPDRRVIQTLAANLDQDPAEEQLLILQNRNNLSLPIIVQVADYDQARKTYYLAWEGTALASASQPVTVSLEDLVGDHLQEILIRGIDESGHPSLDVLRPAKQGGLGLAYQTVFSKASRGTIQIEHPQRPDSYGLGQNSDLSDPIVVDEPDPASKNPLDTVRTTYSWLFQKGEYVLSGTERYQRNPTGDAALDKLYSGDTPVLEAFLQGPWVKVITDKTGLLIAFFDPAAREISFATTGAQEVYHWDVSSRSSRAGLYIVGSNELIELIKLQMSVSVTAGDTVEINAVDNPTWSGTYKRLDPSAARMLAREGTDPLSQKKPPSGLYRNDKGDEFDFQVPEVKLKLGGVDMIGAVAVFPLGNVTVLQLKVPPRPGYPGFSKAYSMETKEEASTSRVVRTIRLQSGVLNSKGWYSDQSDPLRLEQVDTAQR